MLESCEASLAILKLRMFAPPLKIKSRSGRLAIYEHEPNSRLPITSRYVVLSPAPPRQADKNKRELRTPTTRRAALASCLLGPWALRRS